MELTLEPVAKGEARSAGGPRDRSPHGVCRSHPLLSNLTLDILSQKLEKRGHHFVRYTADCNVDVRSRRVGEQVMASVTGDCCS